jgi:xylulose-5-phosphate/fructose-6-phosphate phosphoketolase
MVMLNDLDRYHLVIDVLDRVPGLGERQGLLRQEMHDARLAARLYTRANGEDIPEVENWTWPDDVGAKRTLSQAGTSTGDDNA